MVANWRAASSCSTSTAMLPAPASPASIQPERAMTRTGLRSSGQVSTSRIMGPVSPTPVQGRLLAPTRRCAGRVGSHPVEQLGLLGGELGLADRAAVPEASELLDLLRDRRPGGRGGRAAHALGTA